MAGKNNGKGFNGSKNSQRYSDDELEEFKILINEKLLKALLDYEMGRTSLSHSDSNDIHDTSPTYKGTVEEGASSLSREEASKLVERLGKYIVYLRAALVRIENKTYGICRETGKLISKDRLRAVPHATLGIDVPEKQAEGISPLARRTA